MSISAKELAQKLNISAATVSMVLNRKPGISEKTRNLVLDAAREYGYDFSKKWDTAEEKGSILYVIYKKHGTVVADTPFFSQLTEGIEQACKGKGFELQITYFYENKDIGAQIQELSEKNCQGILLLGTEMDVEYFQPFTRLKEPMVVLDTYFEELDCDSVLINNVQGAYLAARHLIRTCKTQPGYLRSAYQISNFAERSSGFYKAVRAAGMSSSRSIVHSLTPSMEGAYTDMLELIKNGEELASCYFADNDLIAVGAMKALKESGYRIPQDIGIVGFDNLPLGSVVEPALTTIHVPKQYMGEAAAQKLIDLLNTPGHPPTKTEVSTMLVKRGTV